ncbi:MAG: glycosyltransferase family 1 protein [Mycobacteriales bacterium]
MSTIGQVANFVTPSSGGLRTTLEHLASGYAGAGHQVVQVLPGPTTRIDAQPWGRRVTLRSPEVPGTGYRLVLKPDDVAAILSSWGIDRLEVHDRTTLRGLGRWAQRHGIPSLVVNHERVDKLLAQWVTPRLPLVAAANRANRSLAASYDRVVCTTDWAGEEFRRIGVRRLARVPLGVDLQTFTPSAASAALRAQLAGPDEALLVMASRLSKEKRPELAIDAVRHLAAGGRRVRLVVVGDGPMRAALTQRSQALPVRFLGFVRDRTALAGLLASADVAVAPGPVETFGLAALEALASGTPVVVNIHSALPEVIGDAGATSASTARCFAAAITGLLDDHPELRSATARSQAEMFPWSSTVAGFLGVHQLPRSAREAVGAPA